MLRTTGYSQQSAKTSSNDGLKRKRADRPCSMSKRHRTSPSPTSPSASSVSSSTPTWTSTDVDCDRLVVRQSLRTAIRQQNRTRLYVEPIAWTHTHLTVLQVQFHLSPRLEACQHSHRREDAPTKREILWAARQLRSESAEVQQFAIGEILKHYKLEELEMKKKTNRLEIHYGERKATHVLTDGIFKAKSGSGRLAYINLGTLRTLRNEYISKRNPLYLKQRKVQIPNGPVAGLKKKKLQRLKPAVEAEDPYIISVLIALAQTQQRERKTNVGGIIPDNCEVAEKVYAVAFPFIRAQVAYFYKATIPPAFLRKLGKPHKAIRCEGFTVSYVLLRLDCTPEGYLGRLVETLCFNKLLHCANAQS